MPDGLSEIALESNPPDPLVELGIEIGDSMRDYIEARQEFNDSLQSHSSTWQDSDQSALHRAAARLVEVLADVPR